MWGLYGLGIGPAMFRLRERVKLRVRYRVRVRVRFKDIHSLLSSFFITLEQHKVFYWVEL